MPGRAGKFTGLGTILLQPYDEDLDYTFEFEIASVIGNDGAISFGETLKVTPNGSRCEIHKHPEKTDYSTEIIGTVSNTTTVVTIAMSYPYVTLLSSGEAGGVKIINVDSSADMAIGDRIGIVLDSGAIHWDIISAVTSDLIVEIKNGLAGVAAITNKVFVPRIVKGKYHLTIVCYFSGNGDKEFNYNRVFVRDI